MKIKTRFVPSSLIIFVSIIAILLAGVLVNAREKAKSAEAMAKAAQSFLATLTPEQKAKATFDFDNDQRFDWHFVPLERKGLPLKEMNEDQRKAAMALLQSALSTKGFTKASNIISLEPVLAQLEGPNRRFPRDPQLYYVTVFGKPDKNSTWGWRFEGHHISQNFTVTKGNLVIDAPSFFGTNPAEILADMPRKGLKVLGAEEDLGRALIKALDDRQRQKTIYDQKAPADIITFDKRAAQPLEKVGIKASELSSAQYSMLAKLAEEYIGNVPDDVAALRRAKFKNAKKDEIYFAWSGPVDKVPSSYKLEAHNQQPGFIPTGETMGFQGHYYRIQGPSFLIEYDNTQNNANHIHSVWRDFNGDWGKDLLAEHYQQNPHGNLVSQNRK